MLTLPSSSIPGLAAQDEVSGASRGWSPGDHGAKQSVVFPGATHNTKQSFFFTFRLKMDQASVSLLISLLHELAEVSQTRFGKERYQRGMGYS